MSERDENFLGTGWSFPPEFHPRSSTGVLMRSDEEDIHDALWILLSTKPGERVMHPNYGCGLHQMVFEDMSESTITGIKDLVDRAVLFYETRISLLNILVDSSEYKQGLLKLKLEYVIRTTNNRGNMVYPFYINEGTDVVS